MKATRLFLFLLPVLVISCGGGGGDSQTPTTVVPVADDPTPPDLADSENQEPEPTSDAELPVSIPEPQPVPEPVLEPFPGPGPEPSSEPAPMLDPIPATESEPTPEPEPVADNIVQVSFDGITASVISFSTSSFDRLQANALFRNNTGSPLDGQCRIALISEFTEVGFSFISINDLAAGDTVPDATIFLEEGIDEGSFDTVRLSDCFTTNPRPALQTTPEPEFEYVARIAFEDIEVFVLGYDFTQFGRFQVNGLVRNNSSEVVDAQCRLTLISGDMVVDSSFISADDVQPGESVPDNAPILDDSVNQDSFDRVRLSGCFTS